MPGTPPPSVAPTAPVAPQVQGAPQPPAQAPAKPTALWGTPAQTSPAAAQPPAQPPAPVQPAARPPVAAAPVAATPVTPTQPAARPPQAVPDDQPASRQPTAVVQPRPRPTTTVEQRVAQPGDRICGSCGEANDPTRKFCRRCGAGLGEARIVAEKPLPWWRRIFRRGPKAPKQYAAGERIGTMAPGSASAGGGGVAGLVRKGLKVRNLVGLALGLIVAVGIFGYVGIPSFQGMINGAISGGIPGIVDTIRKAVAPTLEIERPVSVTASSEVDRPSGAPAVRRRDEHRLAGDRQGAGDHRHLRGEGRPGRGHPPHRIGRRRSSIPGVRRSSRSRSRTARRRRSRSRTSPIRRRSTCPPRRSTRW